MSASVTLEAATLYHDRTSAVLAKYPEAQRYMDLCRRWSKLQVRHDKLAVRTRAAGEAEELVWKQVVAMKATLPDEVKEALC